MEEVITSAFQSGNVTAIIAAVVVYVIIYLQRNNTASKRDNDSQEIHDKIQKCTWEIARIKENDVHTDQVLEDLRQQCNELNVNLAVVTQKLDNLIDAIKGLKHEDKG